MKKQIKIKAKPKAVPPVLPAQQLVIVPPPEPVKIDLDSLDPMYKVLANRGTKRKFVRLELFDPDNNGELLSCTTERNLIEAFKYYVTHYPALYKKWGGSIGVFRLILCGEYKKSPNSKKVTLMNAIKLTRLELSD